MASEESTDKILDVLYGELSAEENAAARASIASNPVDAEELAAFESLRAQLHEGLAFETPRASVREAILLEAAKQASRRAEGGPRPTRGEEGQARGFWSRISKGTGPQVALVAAVLLAGAFVFNIQTPEHEDALYEAAPSVSLQNQRAPIAPESPEELAKTAEPAPTEVASPLQENLAMAPKDQPTGTLDTQTVGRADRAERARSAEAKPRVLAKAESPLDEAKNAPAARPMAPQQEPRATRGVSKGDYIRDNNIDLDDATAEGQATGPAKKSSVTTTAPAKSKKEDIADFAASAPPAEASDKAQPEPIAAAEKDAAPGSLDAVEQAYGARDWRQVVQASDAVLEGAAPAVQKARALELKAMAYQQMSMFQQALNVYRNIESNYPGYQPDRIQAAQSELERRLEAKPQPSQKTRAKSYDFESDSLNTD